MEEPTTNTTEQAEPEKKKRFGWKAKLILVLIVVLLAAGAYGYYWVQKTYELRRQVEGQIEMIESYKNLRAGLQAEYSRCQSFISQEQGEFGSFEYCQRFTQWVNNNYPELKP